MTSQSAFYQRYIAKLTKGGHKKAVVVISDAMRFEVAKELESANPRPGQVRREDRGNARRPAQLHPVRNGLARCHTRYWLILRMETLSSSMAVNQMALRTVARFSKPSMVLLSRRKTFSR